MVCCLVNDPVSYNFPLLNCSPSNFLPLINSIESYSFKLSSFILPYKYLQYLGSCNIPPLNFPVSNFPPLNVFFSNFPIIHLHTFLARIFNIKALVVPVTIRIGRFGLVEDVIVRRCHRCGCSQRSKVWERAPCWEKAPSLLSLRWQPSRRLPVLALTSTALLTWWGHALACTAPVPLLCQCDGCRGCAGTFMGLGRAPLSPLPRCPAGTARNHGRQKLFTCPSPQKINKWEVICKIAGSADALSLESWSGVKHYQIVVSLEGAIFHIKGINTSIAPHNCHFNQGNDHETWVSVPKG